MIVSQKLLAWLHQHLVKQAKQHRQSAQTVRSEHNVSVSEHASAHLSAMPWQSVESRLGLGYSVLYFTLQLLNINLSFVTVIDHCTHMKKCLKYLYRLNLAVCMSQPMCSCLYAECSVYYWPCCGSLWTCTAVIRYGAHVMYESRPFDIIDELARHVFNSKALKILCTLLSTLARPYTTTLVMFIAKQCFTAPTVPSFYSVTQSVLTVFQLWNTKPVCDSCNMHV